MQNFKPYILFAFFTLCSSSLTHAQTEKRDVDQNVFVLVEATIKDGLYDQFIEVAQYMSDVVSKEEPTALTYQWTVSNDRTTCRILERYTSSETTLGHIALFNEKFAEKLFKLVDITSIQLYGNPSEELLKALEIDKNAYFVSVAGFTR